LAAGSCRSGIEGGRRLAGIEPLQHPSERRRMVFDVSVLLRYGTQTGGIVRVARELARRALLRGDIELAFFDTALCVHRLILPQFARELVEGRAVPDLSGQPERPPRPGSAGFRKKRSTGWLRKPRRRALLALAAMQWRGGKPGRWSKGLYSVLL